MKVTDVVGETRRSDMLVSEAVGFLESQVALLKDREKGLMDRCGALLERARTAEGTNPHWLAGMPRRLVEMLVAAQDLVATHEDYEVDHLAFAEAIRRLALACRVAEHDLREVRAAWADSLHRDPEKRSGRR